MDTAINSVLESGFAGAIIVIMGMYIVFIENKHMKANEKHRQERAEWRTQSNNQFNKIIEVTEKNTSVVSELKGIIKTIK